MNQRDVKGLSRYNSGLLLFYLLFVLLGWLNIYSAAYSSASPNVFDISQLYGRQFLWICAGIIIIVLIIFSDFKIYRNFAWLVYAFTILLLVGIIFFGTEINGNKSWFTFSAFAIQPSEFAKIGTSLALAAYLSSYKIDLSRHFSQLAVALGIILLPVALILMQPDAGSALVFFSLLFVLYLQRAPKVYFLIIIAGIILFFVNVYTEFHEIDPVLVLAILGVLGLTVTIICAIKKKGFWKPLLVSTIIVASFAAINIVFWEGILKPYQRERILVTLKLKEDNRGSGFNTYQSEIAIGSGGFWGKGFLQGTQTKGDFVPEQHTDFIFSNIGEEWGFAGSLVLVVLYTLFLIQILLVAERQRINFARIYGYCVFSIFFFHFFINIAMAIGIMPVIGIPLPFFSYGGSSLWGFTFLLFILMKLDAYRKDMLPDRKRV